MAKEEIRYSDIYIQALANEKVPCVDSGLFTVRLRKSFSLSISPFVLQTSQSQLDVSLGNTDVCSHLNHGHNL